MKSQDGTTVRRLPIPWGAILFLGWLIPGSASWFVNKKIQAIMVFLVIHFMFIYGLFLGSAVYRYDPRTPLQSILEKSAQMGTGVVYWVSLWASEKFREWPDGVIKSFGARYDYGRGDHRHAWSEKGSTFTLTAGLLNILMILKVYDILLHSATEGSPERKGSGGIEVEAVSQGKDESDVA